MIEGVTIGTFRGDYDALEKMAHASWREEYGDASFPNFYRPASPKFTRSRFDEGRTRHCQELYQRHPLRAV